MPITNADAGGASLPTLEAVMTYCNKFFERESRKGNFTVSGGSLSGADFLQPGQYFRISGSVFNDGVHQYGDSGLTDETFSGTVSALAPPRAFLTLCANIDAWQAKHGAAARSPYTSEGFGPYHYTKGSGRASDNGWQAQFALELSRWRRL